MNPYNILSEYKIYNPHQLNIYQMKIYKERTISILLNNFIEVF